MKGIASQDLTCVWKELRAKTRTEADPKDKMEPHLWGTEGDPGDLGRAKRKDRWLLRCARPHGSRIVLMSQLAR